MPAIGQVPIQPSVTAPIPLGAISASSLASLTQEQQDQIVRGTVVVTPSNSYVYTGSGDKTSTANYIDIIGNEVLSQQDAEELIHSTVVGPNTDKVVTFNTSAGTTDSEIGAWGFGVENTNGDSIYVDPTEIGLNNGAKLKKGTTDAGLGGNKGIALKCSVDYELKWEAGRLYTLQQDGFTIRSVEHCMAPPGSADDETKGYVAGTRWVMDSGKTYVCTHPGEDNADWELRFSQDNSSPIGSAGYINTSGDASGNSGGYINTSALGGGQSGGYINTSGNDGAGGSINTSGSGSGYDGGSINTSGGDGAGGSINTSGGPVGNGGAINTYDGGGSINTRGTGSIELGSSVAGTRTTLNGSASGGNKTITLPNATGTVSLTTHTHGNITADGKIGSTASLPLITTTAGLVTTGSFGTTAGSFCQGNDTRLDNRARVYINASGYLATGATTADVWQATFTIPAGLLGPNGRMSVRLWASCGASSSAKRLRAYITNTNPGNAIGGTRICNYNSNASTLALTAISLMRQFTIINRASQSSQIIEPSASGGESATASADAFEETAINTAATWYLVVGLQKDSTADFFQLKQVLVEVAYAT